MAGDGLEPGARFGAYRVVALIGRGGMGAVCRVVDGAGRSFALKVILEERGADEDQRRRFRREAAAARLVRHPGVVSVHDVGEERGVPFLVLELVTGGSLKGLLKSGGAMEWRRAAGLGAEIARALAAIHSAGLVHRDLKPENVLLDAEGRAKISDFGLVRGGAASGLSRGALTKTGALVGTLEYMAPEQSESADVDARADLYALGATLYAMVAGAPPFTGSGVELISKHLRATPRPPREVVPGLPPRFERLILDLLAKRPEARPESAEVVARELEAIAKGAAKKDAAASSRRLVVAVAVLAALLAAGGAAAVARSRSRPAEAVAAPPPPPPPPAPPDAKLAPPRPPLPARCKAFAETERTRLVAVMGEYGRRCHTTPHAGVAFVEGGARVMSAAGRRITKWECATGDEVTAHELPASVEESDSIAWIALSPDTARVAAVTFHGEVLVLDLGDGTWRRLGRQEGGGRMVAWANAETVLATGEKTTLALLADGTGEARPAFPSGSSPDDPIAVTRDGVIVLGCADGTVRAVDLATGVERWRDKVHTKEVWRVAVSPDGKRAVTGGADKSLVLWDTATGASSRLGEVREKIFGVAFASNERVISASDDFTVRVWDTATKKDTIFEGLRNTPYVSIAASPDGKLVAAGGQDSNVRIFELEPVPHLREHGNRTGLLRLGVSADGERAIAADEDGGARVWELASGRELGRLRHVVPATLNAVALSKNGERALTVAEGAKLWYQVADGYPVTLWDVEKGVEIAHYGVEGGRADAVAFSEDEKKAFVVIGAIDAARIERWDFGTGVADWSNGPVRLAVLVEPTPRGDVTVFSREGGHSTFTFGGFAGPATGPIVQGGRLLARVRPDKGEVTLMRGRDGKDALLKGPAGLDRPLSGHEADLLAGALSPRGDLAVTVAGDRTVRLWDAKTGALLDTIDLAPSFDRGESAAFEPSGRRFLIGTARGALLRFELVAR